MDIGKLREGLDDWRNRLDETRRQLDSGERRDWTWYGYDILNNINVLDDFLTQAEKEELSNLGPCSVADIGCADGDFGLMLASQGHPVDLIDWPSTNWNGFRGAPALRDRLGLDAETHQVELDSQFFLPRDQYGVVLFLGLLYHLKNPFYALEKLSYHTRYLFLSTRIAAFGNKPSRKIQDLPVAYLVAPDECNNDATNFWIFSQTGLERLASRTGWKIRNTHTIGSKTSNPADNDADERCFMFLESGR